jgi:hypothetical protein
MVSLMEAVGQLRVVTSCASLYKVSNLVRYESHHNFRTILAEYLCFAYPAILSERVIGTGGGGDYSEFVRKKIQKS